MSLPTQRIRLCRITSWLFLSFRVSDVGLQVGGIVLCWTFCLGAAASLCDDQFTLVLCSSYIINIYLSLKEGETGNVSASMRFCSSRWTAFVYIFQHTCWFSHPSCLVWIVFRCCWTLCWWLAPNGGTERTLNLMAQKMQRLQRSWLYIVRPAKKLLTKTFQLAVYLSTWSSNISRK